VVASPSVVPRAPATPPPPPQRTSVPPSFSRPLTHLPSSGLTAQLEQRLGATQIELRKLGSERHTLRARLRREADRLRELESALRAEKELRAQASDENFAAIVGLRSRLAEVEAERHAETARLRTELEQARRDLEAARSELEQTRSRASSGTDPPPAARANKLPQGLRRIRGIGPAYQRVLEQAGITRVQQIAIWTTADVLAFADKLKIRPERITKEAWIAQAQSLDPDPEE
jgi:predicted flap endonuclease-1-like 5' DNA nuclease